MSLAERFLSVLARILVWISAIFLVAMAVHVTADVVMKYVFNRPIAGTAEVVARYYMLAAVFLPMAFVEMRNSSISVDLVYNLLGRRARRGSILIACLGQLAFFGLLAYQSSIDALDAFDKREFIDGQTRVYIWPATFFLPIGLWSATAVSAIRMLQTMMLRDWEEVVVYRADIDGTPPAGESV